MMPHSLFMVDFKMKKRYILLRSIAFLVIFTLLFTLTTEILKDKRIDGEYNPTTKVRGFYKEEPDSLDFVFLGSSQVYADIAPSVLFRDYGITSYDFCANEQPMWISYYYMKEVLKRQKPKAVILDVFTIYGDDFEEEGVNHINLDDLPFSLNKCKAIYHSVPKDLMYSYYFEIAKYHTTWEGMFPDKFNATFKWEKDPLKGYSPFCTDVVYEDRARDEVVNQNEKEPLPDKAKEWLIKMIELARKENVNLILIKTPNGSPDRQKLYNSVADLAKEQNVPFLNLNTVFDGEAHVNVLQAEKITQYIGEYLSTHFAYDDKRNDDSYASWQDSVVLFERYKAKCQLLQPQDSTEYLNQIISDPNYKILVTVNGITPEIVDKISELNIIGIDLSSYDMTVGSYGAIIENGQILKQEYSNESAHLDYVFDHRSLKIDLSIEDNEFSAKLLVNDVDYRIAKNGIQILVYDEYLKEAVDVIIMNQDGIQR